jgi:hypothetical protein
VFVAFSAGSQAEVQRLIGHYLQRRARARRELLRNRVQSSVLCQEIWSPCRPAYELISNQFRTI